MNAPAELEVFFDGACPLCAREMRLIKRFDRRGRVGVIDIAAPDFDAASYGKTHEDLMARIHARLADGRFVEGVEVFRAIYAAIGLGFVVWLSRVPGISHVLDVGYRWFAANRLRLTGRCADGTCHVGAR